MDNARALADGLLRRDVRLVTGGTDNHLVLMNVGASFGLTGRQAEQALLDAGVVTNRNSVPADPNGAWYTSGVRLGTPALTTLGFNPAELDEVADVIVTALRATTLGQRHGEGQVRPGSRDRRGLPQPLRRPAGPAPAVPGDRALAAAAAPCMPAEPKPFRIEIPQAELADLGQRLRRTRWSEPEERSATGPGVQAA